MKHFILASLLILGSFTLAHGKERDDHPKFDPAKSEQKEFGIAGDPKKVTRTIKIGMSDNMRFTPDTISVKQGETIKFLITNNGKMLHEMVIGTMKQLEQHSVLMKKFPGMEHDAPYMTHVEPGKSGHIVWNFNKPGDFDFACLIAGHFEAGMKGKIAVAATDVVSDAKAASVSAQKVVADASMTDGEVKKIDKSAGKITIKHGPLANLGMPAMTMVFRVKDPAMLDQVKAGEKIKFVAEKVNGLFTVTTLEAVAQ